MGASQRLVNDQLVPLLGGAYQARSVIANAQRCVNLIPEPNQADSEAPLTHYLTPGLTLLHACPTPGSGRGLYWATNGKLYAVVDDTFYLINTSTWAFTVKGSLVAGSTPVLFTDNGTTGLAADGTSAGYEIDLSTSVISAIVDVAFLGATNFQFLDTFVVSNIPATQEFQSTHSGSLVWDPLYVASKTAFSDPLITLAIVNREILLLGKLTSELWYNAGNATFPFAIMQGVFVEHGIAAPYSLARHDLSEFWLSQDKDGQCIVLEFNNYKASRISTYAIEKEFNSYSTISDAIAYTYVQDGHIFYVLNFPTADKTWVYDKQTQLWHERVWLDLNGNEHRHRAMAAVNVGGVIVCQDWETGALYKFDLANFTDNGAPISRRRGFPDLTSNGRRIYYASFMADMETGGGYSANGANAKAQVFLRTSDDGGNSWNNPIALDLGALGQTQVQPMARRLGKSRRRVFELFWSDPVPTALNGAYIDPLPMAT